MAKKRGELTKNTDQILQGIRIVLPGTQALMGFQFIAFFNPVFQNLPLYLKNLHFITLLFTIICSILLIAPVAFQQIAEHGSATNRFLKFTRKMLSTAMLFLLLAIGGDIYLAAKIIGLQSVFAFVIGAILFTAGFLLWYVYAFINRNANE